MKRYRYTSHRFDTWQFRLFHMNPYQVTKARMAWICIGFESRIVYRDHWKKSLK